MTGNQKSLTEPLNNQEELIFLTEELITSRCSAPCALLIYDSKR